MPDEKVRVAFTRVTVVQEADWIGSGDYYFVATIDGRAVGTRSVVLTEHGRTFQFPQPQWSAEIDVAKKTSMQVKFECKDSDSFFDDDLGSVTYVLRSPWRQLNYRSRSRYFTVEWEVKLLIDSSYAFHPPHTIFAARQHDGAVNYTTVSGGTGRLRAEIHPVSPVPAVPPRRPSMPKATAAPWTRAAPAQITARSPLNIIINPAYIPILSNGEADGTTAAVLELSYYQPGTLNFTDHDERLLWTAIPVTSGAAVAFVGPSSGRKVLVYGTAPGEITLEVRMRGAVLTTYRALVGKIKQIKCRFNILNGPPKRRPVSKPTHIQSHLAVANRLLRQAGIELVLDEDTTTRDGARPTAVPGIFTIAVKEELTANLPSNTRRLSASARLNYRPGVLNFAYVHLYKSGAGVAVEYPTSTAGLEIIDSGTPSSSWNVPSGVPPDDAAAPLTMHLSGDNQTAGHPGLYAMVITDNRSEPGSPEDQALMGHTLAHEAGHVLNLNHRGDPGLHNDGIDFPAEENLMHWNPDAEVAQDLDILQVRAMHSSPLVHA
jgi:hypothetical protein